MPDACLPFQGVETQANGIPRSSAMLWALAGWDSELFQHIVMMIAKKFARHVNGEEVVKLIMENVDEGLKAFHSPRAKQRRSSIVLKGKDLIHDSSVQHLPDWLQEGGWELFSPWLRTLMAPFLRLNTGMMLLDQCVAEVSRGCITILK